jgi:hypothetical protein
MVLYFTIFGADFCNSFVHFWYKLQRTTVFCVKLVVEKVVRIVKLMFIVLFKDTMTLVGIIFYIKLGF